MSNVDKLNDIYDDMKTRVEGSLHNTLWQIMVNDSLDGSEAAFFVFFGEPNVRIALSEGGHIDANFTVSSQDDIDRFNEKVFNLTPDQANQILMRSMR